MDEYITKKQVIEWFRCYAHEDRPIRFEDLEFDIQHMIQEDVAQVRHGRLGLPYCEEYYGPFADCKECGTYNIIPCNYCRVCGARMDLEV